MARRGSGAVKLKSAARGKTETTDVETFTSTFDPLNRRKRRDLLKLLAATSEEVVTSNGAEPTTSATSGNGSGNGNGNGAVSSNGALANGNGAAIATETATETLDACDAGQLESCAQTSPRVEKVEGGEVVVESIQSTIDEEST